MADHAEPTVEPSCHYYTGSCTRGPNCPECTIIDIRRSNGGFVAHVMVDGWEPSPGDRMEPALCGYRPSSPVGSLIRNRGRWRESEKMTVWQAIHTSRRWCPKCLEKARKTFDVF